MADVIKSIGAAKDYASVTAWEAASYGATASDVAIGECYGTISENADVTINDTTPTSIILRSSDTDRHDGTPGTGAKILFTNALANINFNLALGVTVEWLEFDGNGLNSNEIVIFGGGGQFTFQNNMVHNVIVNRGAGVSGVGVTGTATTFNFYNNSVFNLSNAGTGPVFGFNIGGTATGNIFNNTVYDISSTNGSGTVYGYNMTDDVDHDYQNNLAYNITSPGTAADYSISSLSNASSTTNFSEDSTSPDGASYRTITAVFTDAANGDFNLEAGSDTILKEGATDLGAVANIDLSGFDRNGGAFDWSGGALNFVGGAPTGRPLPQRVLSGPFVGPLGGPF